MILSCYEIVMGKQKVYKISVDIDTPKLTYPDVEMSSV